MKVKVDIVHGSMTEGEKPVVLCTFFFDGEKITCTNETFLKLAKTMGVVGLDGRTYFPEHGMDFLRALPILYNGPHLKATNPVDV